MRPTDEVWEHSAELDHETSITEMDAERLEDYGEPEPDRERDEYDEHEHEDEDEDEENGR